MEWTDKLITALMAGALIAGAGSARAADASASASSPAAGTLSAGQGTAKGDGIDTVTKPFSVKLGSTRMIYRPDSAGTTLTVINPQDYPILVQSKVLNEDRKSAAPFLVTPPVFRLDANQQSRVRVVRTGGADVPDRETLNWLCITGIPPKEDDVWGSKKAAPGRATLEVSYRIQSCIKMMVRPSSLRASPMETGGSLTFSRQGGKLKVSNPTPYYMTLRDLKVGSVSVRTPDYIPPMGSQVFELAAAVRGPVQWKVVTDYGGDSQVFKGELQ